MKRILCLLIILSSINLVNAAVYHGPTRPDNPEDMARLKSFLDEQYPNSGKLQEKGKGLQIDAMKSLFPGLSPEEIEQKQQYWEQFARSVKVNTLTEDDLMAESNPVLRNTARQQQVREQAMINEMATGREVSGFRNTLDENILFDKQSRTRALRRLEHESAHQHSLDGMIQDGIDRFAASRRDTTVMDSAAAEAYAEEHRVELKFTKNTTKGEVDWAIQRALVKRAMEQDLMTFRAMGDYSLLDRISFKLGTVSGAIGVLSLLFTAILLYW